MDLAAEYARRCATPSDISEFLPRLVELVLETDAGHVIECGAGVGNSTVAWLYGLEQTGGTLTSIDQASAPLEAHKLWRFIQADDLDPTVLADLDQADIVFIDTGHTLTLTRNELRAYRPLVRPGGYVVLHDTELVIGAMQPVKQAAREFANREGAELNFDLRWPGLGEIRLP